MRLERTEGLIMTQCYGAKLVRSLWLIPLFVTWLCLPARAASDAQDKPDAAGLPAPAGDVRPGGQVDVAPFAYAYRKGATDNPVETRWLNPTATRSRMIFRAKLARAYSTAG